MKKTIHFIIIILLIGTTSLNAKIPHIGSTKKLGAFKHMDIAVTAGSTGIGVDLATPLNNSLRLRGGFTFMPHFEYDMDFGITVGEEHENKFDNNGNRVETKFDKLSTLLENIIGTKINDEFNMIGEPSFYNFKLLLDIHPFKNKQWYISTGFYIGSSQIGKAYNTTEDMPTLVATSMYNNIYEKVLNDVPIIATDNQAFYAPDKIEEKILEYGGPIGANIGVRTDGSIYKLVPDENSMVKAKVKANAFRPYLGFGYGNSMMNSDSRYNVSFDCGLLFWGGVPDVIIHDGTNLTKGFRKINGKVGRYIDIVDNFKVFPVINLRISYNIF